MASEQSPKYAICGNSPARACRIKLETFLKILKAEPNRRPGILNTSFNQGKACNAQDGNLQRSLSWLDIFFLRLVLGKGAPRRILKLFLRLFCEGPCLVVFQPSVDFCSQRQNGNLFKLTTMNLRAELHHSFKRNVYLKPSLSQHGLILSEIF